MNVTFDIVYNTYMKIRGNIRNKKKIIKNINYNNYKFYKHYFSYIR